MVRKASILKIHKKLKISEIFYSNTIWPKTIFGGHQVNKKKEMNKNKYNILFIHLSELFFLFDLYFYFFDCLIVVSITFKG